MPRQLLLALSALLAGFPLPAVAAPVDPTESPHGSVAVQRSQPVDFQRDVIPALTKAGCNAGACHGSFQGRGGFQLSLLGFDAAFDYDVLTKASRGRRIAMDSEVALILQDWIRAGRGLDPMI